MSNWNEIKNGTEKGRKDYLNNVLTLAESCESFSQSIYISEKGIVVPCSFMENMPWNSLDYSNSQGWNLLNEDIKNRKDFIDNVWNSDRALAFSMKSANCASCGTGCQVYNI